MGISVGIATAVAVIPAITVASASGVAVGVGADGVRVGLGVGVSVGCAMAVAVSSASAVASASGVAVGVAVQMANPAPGDCESPHAAKTQISAASAISRTVSPQFILPPALSDRRRSHHRVPHTVKSSYSAVLLSSSL